MTKYPLIARVPEIWRRLDKDNVARGLFTAIDNELESIGNATEEYLSLINIDMVQDKFLPMLADLVGHIWRVDKDWLWNRNRIRYALKRASYKGTRVAQTDTIVEFGGEVLHVLDMASTLFILGRQGRLGSRDCVIIGPDLYHDGSYLHDIDIHIDTPEFYAEFEKQRPAGHTWWYRINQPFGGISELIATTDIYAVQPINNLNYGVLGRTLINYLPLPYGAVPGFDTMVFPVDWQYLTNTNIGVLGRSLPNTELSINEAIGIQGNIEQGIGTDPEIAVVGARLYVDSVVNASAEVSIDVMTAETAGIHVGFDTQELDEV